MLLQIQVTWVLRDSPCLVWGFKSRSLTYSNERLFPAEADVWPQPKIDLQVRVTNILQGAHLMGIGIEMIFHSYR
jgi:hypothetical protein